MHRVHLQNRVSLNIHSVFIRCAEHMAGPPAKAAALALGSVSPEGQITNAR